MENINLVESFAEFKEFKNIDRATLMSVLEDIFKKYAVEKNTVRTRTLTSSSTSTKVTSKSGGTGLSWKMTSWKTRTPRSL